MDTLRPVDTPVRESGSASPNAASFSTHPVLQESAEIAAVRLSDAVCSALRQSAADLAYTANQPHMAGEYRIYLDALDLARKREAQVCASFKTHFLRRFSVAQYAGMQGIQMKDLKIVGQEGLEKSVAAHTTGQQIREHCGTELYGLEQHIIRIIGIANTPVSGSGIPFGPEMIALSFMDALEEQFNGTKAKLLLLASIDRFLPGEVRKVYRDLNHFLAEKAGISPVSLPEYAVAEGGTDARRALPAQDAMDLVLPEAPALPDPAEIKTARQQVSVQHQAVTGHASTADRLQEKGRIAASLETRLDPASWPDALAGTILKLRAYLLAKLGRNVELDGPVGHRLGLLLQRLQDVREIWRDNSCPEDQFCAKLAAVMERLMDQHDHSEEALFEDALEDLGTLLTARGRAQGASMKSRQPFAMADRGKIEFARLQAHQVVQARLRTYAVPDVVRTFLIGQWEPWLVQLHIAHGDSSADWSRALSTMDDLVWSVLPKVTGRDQKRMIEFIPELLKRLEAELLSAGVPSPVRDQFFANLIKCHAEAMRVGQETRIATQSPSQCAATPDVSAQRQAAASLIDELSEQSSVTQDAGMEACMAQVGALKKGAQVEFLQADGTRLSCKLAWVSPMRGMYLFTNMQGQRALSIKASGLAEKFRKGEAKILSFAVATHQEMTDMPNMKRNAA